MRETSLGHIQYKWKVEAYGHSGDNIYPPESPCEADDPLTPSGNTDKSKHVDDGGQAHGNGS